MDKHDLSFRAKINQFNSQLAELRGAYGRKGKVGGSSKSPTSSSTSKGKFSISNNEERTSVKMTVGGKDVGEAHYAEVVGGYFMFEGDLSEDEYNKLFPDDSFIAIEDITIKDEFKGVGYGKELMKKTLESISKSGFKKVYLNASPMGSSGIPHKGLVDFYKKFGFKPFLSQGNNTLMVKDNSRSK